MLPKKSGKPIAFKCTEELRQQTETISDSMGESLSDYVRKAVEMRNALYGKVEVIEKLAEKGYISNTELPEKFRSFPKGG